MHIQGNAFDETCDLLRIGFPQIESFEVEIRHSTHPRSSLVAIGERVRFD